MKIQLSDHFTYRKLLRFTFPTIIMMIFTSIYGVVDGYFVSNYAGKEPFAALNYIFPVLMIFGMVGFIFGSGGSALVAKSMGEGKDELAKEQFSLIVYTSIVASLIIGALGIIFLPNIAILMNAGKMLDDCVLYGRIYLAGNVFFTVQIEFQTFFITAEKPKLGLISTIMSGCTNMILDFLFLGVFRLGLAGAASATILSQAVGAFFALGYFSFNNKSRLKFTRCKLRWGVLGRTISNGISEFVTNISLSIVGILYNLQLMKYGGENGVAAYGVIMYVSFIFCGVFFGYQVGVSPIISFHYGAQNKKELKNLLQKTLVIYSICACLMVVLCEVLAIPLSKLFVGYDKELMDMTIGAFRIFAFSFMFLGFGAMGSAWFTALNDGVTSAVLSLIRTFGLQIICILILPVLFGINGIWYATVISEALAAAICFYVILIKRRKYGY